MVNTLGRTPLDEGAARRRELYVTAHNTHKRQTSMPPAGFEPAIPASERPQTHALDRVTTEIGRVVVYATGYPVHVSAALHSPQTCFCGLTQRLQASIGILPYDSCSRICMLVSLPLIFPYNVELYVYIEEIRHITGEPYFILVLQPFQLIAKNDYVISDSELQYEKFSFRVVIKAASDGCKYLL